MEQKSIQRLLFVFNADAGLWSAIVDSTKKLLMINGCALCSLTHGIAGEKSEWKSCKDELGVPIDYVHRDELTPKLREAVEGKLPCILAEANGEFSVLLTPDVLDRCRGSIPDMRGKIYFYASAQNLKLPSVPGRLA